VNKSLLIIICDFLLISILALVEFTPAEPKPPAAAEVLAGAEADLVDVLRLSLEYEAERGRLLTEDLDSTRADLAQTATDLELTAAERARIAAERDRVEAERQALRGDLDLTEAARQSLAADLARERRQAEQLQGELRAKLDELARAEAGLTALEQERGELQQRQRRLETDIRVRETEAAMLEQNLLAARAEVDRARIEAERAQQRAEQLATNVGELAATSTAMRDEFRDAQPLSLNVIYRQFEDNRLRFDGATRLAVLFGFRDRTHVVQALPVRSGDRIFAVLEAGSAGLAPAELDRILRASASLRIAGMTVPVGAVSQLADDPRILLVEIPPEVAASAGLQPFVLAREPLRFPDAVLISNGAAAYGEFPIRTPPGEPAMLSVEARFLTRLLGDFAPTRGDFVFAKSGEWIGVMVENNRARIVRSLQPGATIRLTEIEH
jgi:hypothetical protein